VERPAHLSPDQRRRAQERTREWRQLAVRSQADMASAIGVSTATYRSWESSRDDYAGPTRILTEALNRALRQLLRDQYVDGEAFDVWGWPRNQDMSHQQVTDLLRSAGFWVPRPQANAQPLSQVFWPHRVREAHLVHGVFSLAAAAATRAGLTVHLLLDDVGLPERKRSQSCSELESWVRTWVAFASGDDTKVTVGLFSSVLTEEYLAEHAWRALNDYLDENWALKFLLASKVVSPLRFRTHSEKSVLELLGDDRESLKASRLLTPLRNWIAFEAEITRLLRALPARGSGAIITLGGDDERDLWEMWDGGCAEGLSTRVQHMYLRTMPIPGHIEAWDVRALRAGDSDRHTLREYLTSSADLDLIEWLLRSAIRLPAALNPGFKASLDPMLLDVEAILRMPPVDLNRIVGEMASAIAKWLTT
jgi:DNA-binding XRE family transcriptional regulator